MGEGKFSDFINSTSEGHFLTVFSDILNLRVEKPAFALALDWDVLNPDTQ